MKTAKISSRWRWFLSLGAVCAVIALAVATMPVSAPAEYIRYVGPPLKDGSRVTFLHPASVSEFLVSPGGNPIRPYIAQDVQIAKPFSANIKETILSRLPLWKRLHPVSDQIVGVLVTKISKIYLSKHLIVSGRIQRQYIQQTFNGPGNAYVDEVDVTNAHNGLQYAFQYKHIGSSKSADFAKHEAAITNSFQVLPPGAAPPVP